ncbi:MAG: phage tail protein [Nakamurella sp.]
MPNFLQQDTLIAQNFFLEIKGDIVTYLSGVSGLDLSMDVAESIQVGPDGKKTIRKMLGAHIKPSDLSLTRVAPPEMAQDALWKWFNTIYQKGMPHANRGEERKDGSIVIYDSAGTEVARFNFFNGWPSKISTDALSVDSNDPVKETITLTIERLERVK